jgi:hypothetical protein
MAGPRVVGWLHRERAVRKKSAIQMPQRPKSYNFIVDFCSTPKEDAVACFPVS